MEFESELQKVNREEKERKTILTDVLKGIEEIELFQLKQEENEDSTSEGNSFEQMTNKSSVHPTGVKFFNGDVNCLYNHNTIKSELNLEWCNYEELDLTAILDINRRIHHEYVVDSFQSRISLFKFFYKLLFTDQSRDYLYAVTSILLELISKANHINAFLQIALETLPMGIKNLGGHVNKVYEDESPDVPQDSATVTVLDQTFSPVENIRFILKILQYLITKENSASKGKPKYSDVTLDNLVFLFVAISQDPFIVRSNIIASIQNFLATILDFYPSDSSFMVKVQDFVERIVKYWDTSVEGFSHHTSFFVACDVIPFSIRGKQLKASFAVCALMCCLTPDEVEVLDVVHLSTLSKFCIEHTDELVSLDFDSYYSVVRLIDAVITRPFNYETDGKYLKEILGTVNRVYNSKENQNELDWYHKPRMKAILEETTSEWNRLLVPPEKSNKSKRKLH